MSATKNPQAFPSGDFTSVEPGYGMTLRDWFAGQALAVVRSPDIASEAVSIAAAAYFIADAMLAERERGQ